MQKAGAKNLAMLLLGFQNLIALLLIEIHVALTRDLGSGYGLAVTPTAIDLLLNSRLTRFRRSLAVACSSRDTAPSPQLGA